MLTADSQPETVVEVDEMSDPEDRKSNDDIQIEETDDILAIKNSDANPNDSSMLNSSVLEVEDDEYNWNLEDVVGLPVSDGQRVVDFDSIEERLLVVFDNLKLVEVNIQSKQVINEFQLSEVEGADQLVGQKATSFAMFKDLNMLAISTEQSVFFFTYEEGELMFLKVLDLPRVCQVCFIELYVVLVQESEDATEATILAYQLDGDEPDGQISIRQFMGRKVKITPGDNAIFFATGSLIGKITVPEMELEFQEESGHEIIDFAAHDTCIFTT